MGRIQFTVEDWELRYFRDFANRKGMTVSQLAKISIFQYEARHGLKTLSMDNSPFAQKSRTQYGSTALRRYITGSL